MYVAIRSYSGQGASELFDALAERHEDVKARISTVPGFISYEAFRNNGGGQTVTVTEKTRPAPMSPPDVLQSGSRRTSASKSIRRG